MAVLINDNYTLLTPNKPFDARYFNITNPWATCAEALAGIPTYRYQGLTINIAGEEWWWKDGTGDTDLIQKSLGGTSNLSGVTNGLSLFNAGTCVGLGGDLNAGTTINLCDNSLKFQSDSTNVWGLLDVSLNTGYTNSSFGVCTSDSIVTGAMWGICGNCASISAFHKENPSNGSCIEIKNTGLTLTDVASSISRSVTLGSNALVYAANYCDDYTDRSLVDREYVITTLNTAQIKSNGEFITGAYYTYTCDEIIAVSGVSSAEIYLPTVSLVNGRGQRITVVDVCGNAFTDPIIVNGNGPLINNSACSLINTDYGSVTFIYNGASWSAIGFIN